MAARSTAPCKRCLAALELPAQQQLGQAGNDKLDGSRGEDKISGGEGNDLIISSIGSTINSKGGARDEVNCGPGRSRERHRNDRLKNCEHVTYG